MSLSPTVATRSACESLLAELERRRLAGECDLKPLGDTLAAVPPTAADDPGNPPPRRRGRPAKGSTPAEPPPLSPGLASLPVYLGEFWTARQRQVHSIHEVSYRACFKPQLPAFFLDHASAPGEPVYDPFMGRGTTLVEAALRGRLPAGNDANPLSVQLVQPRLQPPPLTAIQQRLTEVKLPLRPPADDAERELLVFFHPDTLAELLGWRDYFAARRAAATFDAVDGWIEMVACNRLTGHSRGFFSVYTLPPNQATSVKAQRRINERRDQQPDYRDTRQLIGRKTLKLFRDPLPAGYGRDAPLLLSRSADHTPELDDSSIALVVTSPPFLNVVQYDKDNWMRSWFAGRDIGEVPFWQSSSLPLWVDRMRAAFTELHRVVQPGGVIAFEVGEVGRGKIELEHQVLQAAVAAGLVPLAIMINQQNFTKTANCWGVANNQRGTNSNRIVVLERKG